MGPFGRVFDDNFWGRFFDEVSLAASCTAEMFCDRVFLYGTSSHNGPLRHYAVSAAPSVTGFLYRKTSHNGLLRRYALSAVLMGPSGWGKLLAEAGENLIFCSKSRGEKEGHPVALFFAPL